MIRKMKIWRGRRSHEVIRGGLGLLGMEPHEAEIRRIRSNMGTGKAVAGDADLVCLVTGVLLRGLHPVGLRVPGPHQDLPCPVGSVWLGSVQREDEGPAGSPSACQTPWDTGPDIPAFRSQTPACHLSIFSGHMATSLTTSSREDPCPGVKPRP